MLYNSNHPSQTKISRIVLSLSANHEHDKMVAEMPRSARSSPDTLVDFALDAPLLLTEAAVVTAPLGVLLGVMTK
jgi:hypothetical protein